MCLCVRAYVGMCMSLSVVCRYLEAVKQLKKVDMRFGMVVLSFPLVFLSSKQTEQLEQCDSEEKID